MKEPEMTPVYLNKEVIWTALKMAHGRGNIFPQAIPLKKSMKWASLLAARHF